MAENVIITRASTDLGSVTADTDALAAEHTPKPNCYKMHISAVLATAGVLSIMETVSGTTNAAFRLNALSALSAQGLYEFEFLIVPGATYNFQSSVTGLWERLVIAEKMSD